MRVATGLAVALFASGVAQAAPTDFLVTLADGQRVVVTALPKGKFRVGPLIPKSEIRPFTIEPDKANASRETTKFVEAKVSRAAPGTLAYTFWIDPRDGTHLRIDNGLGHPVIYSAEIVAANGRSSPTTICSVPANKVGYESWVDKVVQLKITGIYDAPAGKMVCGHPERGEVGAPPT